MKLSLHLLLSWSLTSIAIAQDLYCLGRLNLAGLPPSHTPTLGESLLLKPESRTLHRSDGSTIGHIPSVYWQPIHDMHKRGVILHFDVLLHHAQPEPGRFVMVEVWAEPKNPRDLEPLVYRIRQREATEPETW